MNTAKKLFSLVIKGVYSVLGVPPKPTGAEDKRLGPDWEWKAGEVYSYEPLSVFMFDKLRINTTRRIVIVMILWGIVSLYLTPYFTGYLLPGSGGLSSLEDWPSHIDAFILTPLIMSFFLIQPVVIKKIFIDLAHNGAINTTEKDYDSFAAWVVESFRWKWWPIICLLIISVTYLPWLVEFMNWPIRWWYYPNRWVLLLVYTPYNMMQWYIGWTITWRYFVALIVLYTLFKQFPLQLALYDAKKAGGFSSIGDLIVSTSIFLCAGGLHLVVLSYALWNPNIPDPTGSIMGVWVAYVIVLFIILSGPFIVTYRAMRREKTRLTKSLELKSQEVMKDLEGMLKQGKIEKGSSDLISEIQTLGKQIEELPTSPLDFSKLSKISIVVVVPLLSGFYSKLIEKISINALDRIAAFLTTLIN